MAAGGEKIAGKDLPGRTLWLNARLATLDPALPGLGMVERGAVAAEGGRIVYAGAEADLPASLRAGAETVDVEGRLITPGLIDCHTHLVYAGNRAHEFELRLKGASYEEVARAGGGIVSSVKALRAASEADLVRETLPRLDALIAEGVTTVEVKSGYGLDRDSEIKALKAARKLAEARPVAVRTTFLGAHALPPEMNGDKAAYIDKVVDDMLPAVAGAGLVDAVDGFCEGIAFSPEEIARVFDAAKALGLPVKLHADQLSNLHGAALAASYGALSADHLEYLDEAGVQALRDAGTVAVLLSTVFYAYNLILSGQQALVAKPGEIMLFQNLCITIILGVAAPWLAVALPSGLWLPLAGVTALSLAGQFLMSWSYARAEAQYLIPTEYSAFIWAIGLGWLFFDEAVTWTTLAGAGLIVASCLIASRSNPKLAEPIEAAV